LPAKICACTKKFVVLSRKRSVPFSNITFFSSGVSGLSFIYCYPSHSFGMLSFATKLKFGQKSHLTTAFLFIATALSANYLFPGIASATTTALFFILFHTIITDANIYSGAALSIYGHIPNWILIIAYTIPAAWIDISKKRSLAVKALVASVLWSVLFFGFANTYLSIDFRFSMQDFSQALVASIIGGVLAAIFFHSIERGLKRFRPR